MQGILGLTSLVTSFAASFTAGAVIGTGTDYEIKPAYGITERFETTVKTNQSAALYDGFDAYFFSCPETTDGAPTELRLADGICIPTAESDGVYLEYTTFVPSGAPTDAADIGVFVTAGGTERAASVTVSEVGADGAAFAYNAGKTAAKLYRVTTENLRSVCVGAPVTGVRLLPCTRSGASGTFRLVSLRIYRNGVNKRVTVPAFPQYENLTLKTVEKTAAGYSAVLYATDFSFLDGWTSNTTVYKTYEAEADGKKVNYAGFALGKSRIIEATYNVKVKSGASYTVTELECKPLKVISPYLVINTSEYESVPVAFRYWTNENNESAPSFELYYSVNGGAEWNTGEAELSVRETGEKLSTGGNNVYGISEAEFDLKKLSGGGKVTNIMLCPYPDIKNGTNEYFRLLDFRINSVTSEPCGNPANSTYDINYDSMVIQKMIDDACAAGKTEVTVPSVNPRTGTDEWLIAKEIVLPSDMTVYLDNCTLTRYVYSYCNIFTVKDAYKKGITAENEIKNVKIIGIGNAAVKAGLDNGHNKYTRTGRDNLPYMYTNCLIFFRNVNGFEVRNLTVIEPTFWSMCYVFCTNGKISGITFRCTEKMINQDGIDLRLGNSNITVSDIRGATGDDSVALNELVGNSEKTYAVVGKSLDTHDITIKNVATRVYGSCFNVRLLAHDGGKIYNVTIENITDTGISFASGKARAAVVLGHPEYYVKTPMAKGDIDNITVNGVTSKGSIAALWVYNKNITAENFKADNIKSTNPNVPAVLLEK